MDKAAKMSITTNYIPTKIYYTGPEVAEITGLSLGLCFYYRGKIRKKYKPSSPSQKFTAKEVQRILNEDYL